MGVSWQKFVIVWPSGGIRRVVTIISIVAVLAAVIGHTDESAAAAPDESIGAVLDGSVGTSHDEGLARDHNCIHAQCSVPAIIPAATGACYSFHGIFTDPFKNSVYSDRSEEPLQRPPIVAAIHLRIAR